MWEDSISSKRAVDGALEHAFRLRPATVQNIDIAILYFVLGKTSIVDEACHVSSSESKIRTEMLKSRLSRVLRG